MKKSNLMLAKKFVGKETAQMNRTDRSGGNISHFSRAVTTNSRGGNVANNDEAYIDERKSRNRTLYGYDWIKSATNFVPSRSTVSHIKISSTKNDNEEESKKLDKQPSPLANIYVKTESSPLGVSPLQLRKYAHLFS